MCVLLSFKLIIVLADTFLPGLLVFAFFNSAKINTQLKPRHPVIWDRTCCIHVWRSEYFSRINEEFLCLLFLNDNRETSPWAGELSEESDQFRFIRPDCFPNLKGSIGLMLAKVSRVIIPLDLSTWTFIPLPRFIRTRNTTWTSLLTPSLVLFTQSSVKWCGHL